MANAFVLRDVWVAIDGVNLSDHVKEVSVELSADDVDVTAMGAGGHQHLAGLRNDKFTFTMFSDFASNKVHATVSSKFTAAGTVEVKVTAASSTVSATNPLFIGYCPVLSYNPVSGGVGDAATTPLELPASGTITVSTTGTIP